MQCLNALLVLAIPIELLRVCFMMHVRSYVMLPAVGMATYSHG